SGAAFAAEEDPQGFVKARGEVIDVNLSAGKFKLEKSDGTIMTFFVDENTRFRGRVESLEDLQVGWKAGVAAHEGNGEGEGGKLLAVLVIAGDPAEYIQARGEITGVDPGAGTYQLQKPDGIEMTFLVNENTRYGGQINSLDDLQVGWKAAVAAKKTSEGGLMTLALIAGDAPELVKAKGVVTSVDAGAGQFEIKKPDGTTGRYFVNEKTRYQGQLSSLDEMQVGWQAAVAAKVDDDGKLMAVLVIAGTRPEVIRARGTVSAVAVGAGKFKLTKPDGTVLTIFVDENTHFRGQAANLSELENGWRAGVVAVEQADGKLLARLVVSGKPRAERPPADSELSPETRYLDLPSSP
ncbi:MAG: hypothetical protein GQ562_03035, partial [Anaerolineales bacterium]|nr:hypothetical protein [Anaerolineales bacterium]